MWTRFFGIANVHSGDVPFYQWKFVTQFLHPIQHQKSSAYQQNRIMLGRYYFPILRPFLRKGFVSQIWKSSPWCELFPLPNSSFSYDLLDPKKPVSYETTKQHCFIHQMAHISGLLDFTSSHLLFKHVHPENLGEMLTHVDYKNWSEPVGSKATKSTKKSDCLLFGKNEVWYIHFLNFDLSRVL